MTAINSFAAAGTAGRSGSCTDRGEALRAAQIIGSEPPEDVTRPMQQPVARFTAPDLRMGLK
jgi:hypothetical protein